MHETVTPLRASTSFYSQASVCGVEVLGAFIWRLDNKLFLPPPQEYRSRLSFPYSSSAHTLKSPPLCSRCFDTH